jgi:aspartyl-tRNA(Asn)/glutamyl-tRNA(Gln) amidotransferase subunit A
MARRGKSLCELTIHEARGLIAGRELSPVELTRAILGRIEALDSRFHAYLKVMSESALEEARQADAEIVAGRYRGPLHGVPVAVKDQLDAKGAPAAIRKSEACVRRAGEDSTVVRRLREAGAVILGKLAMSGLPGDHPPARNPWHTDYTTGGSSTGAGAAVAAGLCVAAIGEDTSGSIRSPAAHCGIVGLKPTYGRVSRYGLAPLSWSLDHCGPMTRVVEDAAYMLQAVAGHDPRDLASSRMPVPDYGAALTQNVKRLALGVPRAYLEECSSRTDTEMVEIAYAAIRDFKSLGARVREVSIPSLKLATIANSVIYYNEYFAVQRKDLATTLKSAAPSRRARLYLGLLTGAGDYIQALRLRGRIRREFADLFQTIDLLALPAEMVPPSKVEGSDPLEILYRHMAPEFFAPFNLAGLPALVLPCGFSRAGLPVSLQLVGRPFDEPTVLRAAYSYQQHAKWYERRPRV